MSGCSGNRPTEQNNVSESGSSSMQSSQISSTTKVSWVRVDRQVDWPKGYKFPAISFQYPLGWKFNCCGDMDYASQHLLCPNEKQDDKSHAYVSTFKESCSKNYISITDYVLAGCPTRKPNCSIDEQKSKTAREKYDELVNSIRTNTDAQILPIMHLPKLGTDAFVYTKDNHLHSYLMNLGNDVIEVEFSSTGAVDDTFVADFFSRMTWDRK